MLRKKRIEAEFDFKTLAGFDKLYHTYAPNVFSLFMYNLGNRELAEDFVQEIFTNLWFKRHSISIEGSIENYLIRSAKFKLINYYRKKQKEKLFLSVEIVDKPDYSSPEEQLIYKESKENVCKIVKKMPRTSRRVFFLSRAKGLSNREISKIMALSEKAVEYHIGKILKRLRKFSAFLF